MRAKETRLEADTAEALREAANGCPSGRCGRNRTARIPNGPEGSGLSEGSARKQHSANYKRMTTHTSSVNLAAAFSVSRRVWTRQLFWPRSASVAIHLNRTSGTGTGGRPSPFGPPVRQAVFRQPVRQAGPEEEPSQGRKADPGPVGRSVPDGDGGAHGLPAAGVLLDDAAGADELAYLDLETGGLQLALGVFQRPKPDIGHHHEVGGGLGVVVLPGPVPASSGPLETVSRTLSPAVTGVPPTGS